MADCGRGVASPRQRLGSGLLFHPSLIPCLSTHTHTPFVSLGLWYRLSAQLVPSPQEGALLRPGCWKACQSPYLCLHMSGTLCSGLSSAPSSNSLASSEHAREELCIQPLAQAGLTLPSITAPGWANAVRENHLQTSQWPPSFVGP